MKAGLKTSAGSQTLDVLSLDLLTLYEAGFGSSVLKRSCDPTEAQRRDFKAENFPAAASFRRLRTMKSLEV